MRAVHVTVSTSRSWLRLTNSLLDEGAGGLTADQISQGFDNLGANYGGSAGYDSASISLRSLSDLVNTGSPPWKILHGY